MSSASQYSGRFIGLLFFFTSLVQAEVNVVNFAVYEYPPLYHTSISGRFSGTLGETVLNMCGEAQLQCKPTVSPIARAYEQVISGQFDMTISATHPRFDACCIASEWSYPWSAGFFSRLESAEIPVSEEKMKGRSVIVVRGWRSHYRFMPNFDQMVEKNELVVLYANSNYSAIQMLKNGRAELLWGSVDYLWYLEQLNLSDRFNYAERLKIPLVLWVNKQRISILKKLNAAYFTLQKSNVLDQQNLLRPHLLHRVYEDAPLKKGQ